MDAPVRPCLRYRGMSSTRRSPNRSTIGPVFRPRRPRTHRRLGRLLGYSWGPKGPSSTPDREFTTGKRGNSCGNWPSYWLLPLPPVWGERARFLRITPSRWGLGANPFQKLCIIFCRIRMLSSASAAVLLGAASPFPCPRARLSFTLRLTRLI